MSAEGRLDVAAAGRRVPQPTGSLVAIAAAGLAAAVGGALAATSLVAAAALLLAAVVSLLLLAARVLMAVFLAYAGILLLGYWFFGRAFAYLGAAPLYVGEVGLALAVLVVLRERRLLRPSALEVLLLAFMGLGAVHTFTYVPRDGLDALRDGVLWGYAFFALAAASALRAEHFPRIVTAYGRILPFFLVWVIGAPALSLSASLPTVPGSDVSVVTFKGGDMGVHLAGVAAFLVVGLFHYRRTAAEALASLLLPLWLVALAVAGSINRGGLFAATVGWFAAFLLRPTRWGIGIVLAGLLLSVAVLADPTVDWRERREISIDQIGANVLSAVWDTGDPHLDATRDFRLGWWGEIVDYTVFGPYFWTGKGFGVNLADEDGFQVRRDGSVRAPHNSHITVLARMGVPGFALWVALQVVFAWALFRAFRRARRNGDVLWAQVYVWLLFYWAAMMVNSSFDPYLEGPQGGIWFWSLFGAGLAALRLQRQEPAEVAR